MDEEWTAAVSAERARRDADLLVASFDDIDRLTRRLQYALGAVLVAGAGLLAVAWTA